MSEIKKTCPPSSDGVGLVETKYFQMATDFTLESGEILGRPVLAYETYGELNENGDNVILVFHALTGSAHAAGKNSPDDRVPGWWDEMIGPGRAFDTDRFFVVCSNVLGGCYGSTGPGSVNPATGRPYGMDFPVVTIKDMVKAQKALLDYLGVRKVQVAVGGSMGGMQALEWAVQFPEDVEAVVPIGCPGRLSPQAIAFNEVGRRAITLDPHWNNGNYYENEPPSEGLALARMIGTITYKSEDSFQKRFGRSFADPGEKAPFQYDGRFEVESYLHYQGKKLVKRFDANSYLYLTKALDLHDVARGFESYEDALGRVRSRVLIIGISSDILYPPYEQKEVVAIMCKKKKDVTYFELESCFGHDAFLVEFSKMNKVLTKFVEEVYNSRSKSNKKNFKLVIGKSH